MGGVCSAVKQQESAEFSGLKSKKKLKTTSSFGKRNKREVSDPSLRSPEKNASGELRHSFTCQLLPSTPPRKSGDVRKSSFLGKVGTVGLEKAVEVLDVLGSGVTNLNSSALISSKTIRGNKISVLSFEVANTITKGASLLQSLSEENVSIVKQKIFSSEGVQCLVSTDTKVLQSIAASDKREELNVFSREVVRFGDLCKDPQWHNLDRFFSKLESEPISCIPLREDVEQKMNDLTVLAQQTAELYHELNTYDRFEQEYQQKHEEAQSTSLPYHADGLETLLSDLKHQKRLVLNLKRKKSLWSKRMEEVTEKLVDIVIFIHHQISESFTTIDAKEADKANNKTPERLGSAGLALHYAKVIMQIDNISSRPSCLPPSTRNSLYQGLPASVKNNLRYSLGRSESNEELSLPQIKAEMNKTLDWLVPMATTTSKMYQGFGWVGEWANTSNIFHEQNASSVELHLQTLYHAEKQKTDYYILELVKWLHRLINATRTRDCGLVESIHFKSTNRKNPLSHEERNLLEKVSEEQTLPIFSKSQRFNSDSGKCLKMGMSFQSNESFPCKREDDELDDRDSLEVVKLLDLAV